MIDVDDAQRRRAGPGQADTARAAAVEGPRLRAARGRRASGRCAEQEIHAGERRHRTGEVERHVTPRSLGVAGPAPSSRPMASSVRTLVGGQARRRASGEQLGDLRRASLTRLPPPGEVLFVEVDRLVLSSSSSTRIPLSARRWWRSGTGRAPGISVLADASLQHAARLLGPRAHGARRASVVHLHVHGRARRPSSSRRSPSRATRGSEASQIASEITLAQHPVQPRSTASRSTGSSLFVTADPRRDESALERPGLVGRRALGLVEAFADRGRAPIDDRDGQAARCKVVEVDLRPRRPVRRWRSLSDDSNW